MSRYYASLAATVALSALVFRPPFTGALAPLEPLLHALQFAADLSAHEVIDGDTVHIYRQVSAPPLHSAACKGRCRVSSPVAISAAAKLAPTLLPSCIPPSAFACQACHIFLIHQCPGAGGDAEWRRQCRARRLLHACRGGQVRWLTAWMFKGTPKVARTLRRPCALLATRRCQCRPGAAQPLECRRGVVLLHAWLDKWAGSGPQYHGPAAEGVPLAAGAAQAGAGSPASAAATPPQRPLSRQEVLNRYEQHTRHCPSCRRVRIVWCWAPLPVGVAAHPGCRTALWLPPPQVPCHQ